jgi:AraC family transcriptional regulator, regulatory protein of adaptative response / methylated-DNA-[protein]-cysteine methyltransferase
MSDYERIAGAIRFLERHRHEQPALETVASAVGLSASRFHRLFSAWAGATPKDFLQCLTLGDAKDALKRGSSVLDAALDAGLSGPGRLHDLCVTLEAATPGEIKARGKGLTVHHGVADSPFGSCLMAKTPRGICHLAFFDEGGYDDAFTELQAEWPSAELIRTDAEARQLASAVFDPHGGATWKLHVRGTAFQLRVWRALLAIPPGDLASYAKLAALAGNRNAFRATGSAVGFNPVSFLIPCHRVIRSTGIVGNYRWGGTRKRAMLAWEAAKRD